MLGIDKWTAFFFSTALTASRLSKDPSTKVGSVIAKDGKVISTGYNGFPKGWPDAEEFLNDRELKYKLVEHAERNAISQALHNSGSIRDGAIYVTHCPCTDCAKGIIQAGIKSVSIPHYPEFEKRWGFDFTEKLLTTCGVDVRRYRPEDIRSSIQNFFDIDMTFLPGEPIVCREC